MTIGVIAAELAKLPTFKDKPLP